MRKERRRERVDFQFLRPYWRTYRRMFAAAVFCVVLETFCDLTLPRLTARMIDDGVMKLDREIVVRTGLIMLGVTALGALFACLRNILASRASQRFGAQLRRDLFAKIQSLRVQDAERFGTGGLITRMTNDVTQLTHFVHGLMRVFAKAPVICVGSILLSSTLNIRTFPIVLAVVLAAGASIALCMKLSYPAFARMQSALDRLNTAIREYLTGIRLVRAFGRDDFERARFDGANAGLTNVTRRAMRILGVFGPVSGLAGNLGVAVVVLLGARWVGDGDMQVGQIVAFVSYMMQIVVALAMITNILNIFVRTKASGRRIAEVMMLEAGESVPALSWTKEENPRAEAAGGEVASGDVTAAVEVLEEGSLPQDVTIRFDNVVFRYPGSTGEPALNAVSFTLRPGETLGVIGPTGSGKSTLAALLLRFYEETEGEITWGGAPLSQVNLSALRRAVAVVPQTPQLFAGTVADNIRFGAQDADDSEVRAAAETAEAAEFIVEARGGYDAWVGQGGAGLSGGQKQRLSIARSLLTKPRLLILDDCTSALDALTEQRLLRGLAELFRRAADGDSPLSCILISQRIRTIMRADRVLVLENGEQAGCGTHEQLLESCPVYRDIYASQMGRGGESVG